MPFPEGYVTDFLGNRLIYQERNYDPVHEEQVFQQLFHSFTGNETKNYFSI
jgi:hypothetical protein